MSEDMMANAPAKGPSPTTLIQINAQINVSTLRNVSRLRRLRKLIRRLATTLRAARNPNGMPRMAASKVPRDAMASVCPSAPR
jgi:hypothetical protein